MSSVIDPELPRRNFRTVFACGGAVLAAAAARLLAVLRHALAPAGTTNHGELIEPLRPLPDVTLPDAAGVAAAPHLRGQWTLVYIGDGACDADCRTTLFFMRQTRLSSNNDMRRVQRVFLAPTDCCDREFLAREHPGLRVFDASTGCGAATAARISAQTGAPRRCTSSIRLGNLMMRYDARLPPKGLLEDLQTLLQLSHIG